MSEPDAPTRPTIDELYGQLRALLTEREAILADRSGSHQDAIDAVLLELCEFRGMKIDEAATILGITHQGVSKRLVPLRERLGLTGKAWEERREIPDDRRPYQTWADADLVPELRRLVKARGESQRAQGGRAREKWAAMQAVIVQLAELGEAQDQVADRLGIDLVTARLPITLKGSKA